MRGDGCVAADFNGDGYTDLAVTTATGIKLLWNEGDGTFTEGARAAGNTLQRRELVYGDDSRAWDDIDKLDSRNVSVGTFDVRNYYSPYVARLQLDGLAGSATAVAALVGASVALRRSRRRTTRKRAPRSPHAEPEIASPTPMERSR